MKKWLKIGMVGMLVVGALSMVFTGIAYAQEDAQKAPATNEHRGRGPRSEAAQEAAAEALGMTVDELETQLWGGKSLADLAEEKGVPLEDVQAAVEAAQAQAVRDAIAQAVTDGKITQEHADWLLEGLDKGFIGGSNRFGLGERGFGGRWFAPADPSETSTNDDA
jgi:hypothetical protein